MKAVLDYLKRCRVIELLMIAWTFLALAGFAIFGEGPAVKITLFVMLLAAWIVGSFFEPCPRKGRCDASKGSCYCE